MKLNAKFWEGLYQDKKDELEELFDDEQFNLSECVANSLMEIMSQENISPAELSRRLGNSRAHITDTLKPGRNMTLRTLAKFARVLGYRVSINFEKIDERTGKS